VFLEKNEDIGEDFPGTQYLIEAQALFPVGRQAGLPKRRLKADLRLEPRISYKVQHNKEQTN